MTDVVQKLWGFCHTLRHDGVDYGDYIEQLTYLLFIKMADERGIELPEDTDWPYLRKQSGTDLLDTYIEALRTLGKKRGGQYFTPRLLIQTMVRCVKPDPRTNKDFAIGDPACGTGGFLVAAYE